MSISKASWFSAGITAVYASVIFTMVFHHEPWRDEIQSWLIVIHSDSLSQLYEHTRYEGHPMLWHLLLYGLSFFTHSILAMQLFCACIAVLAVFLFCQYSPFRSWQKGLFVFGFYPLFEYSIIARSYVLIFLWVMLFMVLTTRPHRIVCSWIVLVLMANTSATGLVIALILAVSAPLFQLEKGSNVKDVIKRHGLPFVFFGIGSLIAVWQIYPEADNVYSSDFSFQRLYKVVSTLHDSYTYLAYWPDIMHWSTVYMRELHALDLVISIVLIVVCVWLFYGHPQVLFIYVGATSLLCILLASSGMYAARFMGHFYWIFIMASWLVYQSVESNRRVALTILFSFVLICQCITGMCLVVSDYTQTFSNGLKTAQFIRNQNLQSYPVTGAIDYTISPLSYGLQKSLFYQETQDTGTFIVWSSKRNHVVSPETLIQQTDSLVGEEQHAVIVLSTQLTTAYPIFKGFFRDTFETEQSKWQLIQKMEGALVPDENYIVYLASRKQ